MEVQNLKYEQKTFTFLHKYAQNSTFQIPIQKVEVFFYTNFKSS